MNVKHETKHEATETKTDASEQKRAEIDHTQDCKKPVEMIKPASVYILRQPRNAGMQVTGSFRRPMYGVGFHLVVSCLKSRNHQVVISGDDPELLESFVSNSTHEIKFRKLFYHVGVGF